MDMHQINQLQSYMQISQDVIIPRVGKGLRWAAEYRPGNEYWYTLHLGDKTLGGVVIKPHSRIRVAVLEDLYADPDAPSFWEQDCDDEGTPEEPPVREAFVELREQIQTYGMQLVMFAKSEAEVNFPYPVGTHLMVMTTVEGIGTVMGELTHIGEKSITLCGTEHGTIDINHMVIMAMCPREGKDDG